MKFTFKCGPELREGWTDRTEITYTMEEVGLQEVLMGFENFLRGCGYHFDGSLEIVEQDEYQDDERCECSCEEESCCSESSKEEVKEYYNEED